MNIFLLLIEFDGSEVSRYFENEKDAREYAKNFPRFFTFKIYKLNKIDEF